MDADDVLAALDPEQREVAATQRGPMCVLAGAGTGKTRAITHRIAYGVLSGSVRSSRVLPVTFSVRAANEMQVRLRALGVQGVRARTFHSAALSQLRHFWPKAVGTPMPTLEARKAPHVAAALARRRHRSDPATVRDMAAEIEWAKVSQIAPDDYERATAEAGRVPALAMSTAEVAAVYRAYETVKRERAVIDFEDCLLLTAGMLDERPDVAAVVQQQFTHLVVDEYQDVNSLQQRLLDRWLGDRDSICVVGDPAQTIYSFAGASADHLVTFPRRFPTATVVRLVRDYRSTPQVVALANRLMHRRPDAASAAAVTLLGQRPAGPSPSFDEASDPTAEADTVATSVRALLDGGLRASEIAVLVRVNAQTEAYEQAFGATGVPYVLRGGERFFERPEVRRAVILLRGAARASVDGDGGESRPGLPDQVRAVLSGDGWSSAQPSGPGASRDAWESVAALVQLADDLHAERPEADLPELVADIEERIAAQHAPTVDGVTIATFHAAKGLEWDAVFLVGLNEGLLPISYASSDAEIEEERRLLYVGVTRARERLSLSWSRARSPGGTASRRRSRFLEGIAPESATPRRSPQRQRDKAGPRRSAPADPVLFEALRTWRSRRAAQASTPAFVVFSDATLAAIADRKPSDLGQLLAISGIGASKLERYGEEVLALVRGDDPQRVAEDAARSLGNVSGN